MSRRDPPQSKASVRSSYRERRRKLCHSCGNYTCITVNLMGLARSETYRETNKAVLGKSKETANLV